MTTTSTAPIPLTVFRERNESIRASLIRRGRIQVLPPDEDPETERLYAAERADYTEG